MHYYTVRILVLWGLVTLATCKTLRYSTWMLDSIKERKQGIISSGAKSSLLESGILAIALEATIEQYSDLQDQYAPYLEDVIDKGSLNLTSATDAALLPLDRFSFANAIDKVSNGNVSISAAALRTLFVINGSLSLQERNQEGGLWYYVYPQWSYLDGIFSVLPFMASRSKPNYTDISLQVSLLYRHCIQNNTLLLVHGYDYSRKAVWANEDTGASSYVWGRSLGWFLAGLVQTWETLDCQTSKHETKALCNQIQQIMIQLCTSLVSYADPKTGAWWQLTTFPEIRGNYLESSSTALFIFSLLKGERIGLLSNCKVNFKKIALRAYNYTVHNFVVKTENGTIGFNKTVAVCSLNSTATYEYYTSQPLLPNSLLGESAFVLASLEVEKEFSRQTAIQHKQDVHGKRYQT